LNLDYYFFSLGGGDENHFITISGTSLVSGFFGGCAENQNSLEVLSLLSFQVNGLLSGIIL